MVRQAKGLAGAIMESCVGAFEAVLSYLANTISFVRLAAYAMSHAALLFAAFMLAAVGQRVSFRGRSVESIGHHSRQYNCHYPGRDHRFRAGIAS